MVITNPFESVLHELSEVKSLLLEMKAQQKTDSDFSDYPDLLTRQQAAKMLGIGTTTLDRYANTGVLKKQRSGKMIRFKKSEIIEAFRTFQKWQRV